MQRATITTFAFAVLLVGLVSAANPLALLSNYNVSNSIIGSASFSNITYSGINYTLVNVSGKPYFLINKTGSGSFVLNVNSISEIIGPSITSSLSHGINLSPIASDISTYINSSSASINDCLVETGLNQNTCTASNLCNSCAVVPNCNRALYQTGGPSGVLASGIMVFEQEYNQLQNNMSVFNGYASNTNASNITLRAEAMNAALKNISKITSTIGENPLFPPPASASFSNCGSSGSITFNISSSSGDWYCNAIGYCMSTTYNSTLLAQTQAKLASIIAQLPTNSKILQFAENISSVENTYITPVLVKQHGAQLAKILNTTLSGFKVTINASLSLLEHVNNATLAQETAAASASYTNLTSNYAQINISAYSQKVAEQLSVLRSTYSKLNSSYSYAVGNAKNNTAVLIALQLAGDKSNTTTALAYRQQELNSQLSVQLSGSELSSIVTEINAIAARIPGLGSQVDISLEAVSRAIDGPFVSAMAGALGMSYGATVALAPALSALLSLIIGAIAFALLYLEYRRLTGRHRIRHDARVRKAWSILFIIAAIVVLAYVLGTYVVAASANASAPISAFTGALSSSHAVIIAVNGTVTPSISACAAQISTYAKQRNYTTKTLYISGATCSGNSGVMNTSQCLNQYAAINTPVIMLTQSNSSSISVYSMYGTLIRASGTSGFTSACYVSYFVR